MTFHAILSELVEKVPGALGAILADWEGEAVDQAGPLDTYELRVVGAHKGVILSNLRRVVSRLEGDCLREIVITTERSQTLVLPVTDDYFLVVFLERLAGLGRAQLEARRCLAGLRAEIA
ncbi:MAG: roadblock/LC7 domain-containing protein [Desulfuromonadales bacterium]|nr:roadblock/LC7 domain-containing protein [Desulfuromonadales bacterium]